MGILIRKKGESFKPCYKWNTFNTRMNDTKRTENNVVLNLVISGIPSIQYLRLHLHLQDIVVLNLVISGIPSILQKKLDKIAGCLVLNLVISGIPSILCFGTLKIYII